jgi:hypothetical protein
MANEPTPRQLTVGALRRLLEAADENAVVVLKVPPGFSGDPALALLVNTEVSVSGPVVRIVPGDQVVDKPTGTEQANAPVCFVDVDDTLVRSAGSKRIPMTSMIERVRDLHASGWRLFCWSTAGGTYAKETARELEIESCFAGFLPKPQVFLDDQVPTAWRGVVCIHPGRAQSMSVEDFNAIVS